MARPLFPALPLPVVPIDLEAAPALAERWLLEAWLVRIRWWSLPLCLLALPLFTAAPWPLRLLLPASLGLGNAWLGRLLRLTSAATGLRLARRFSTGFDWLLGLVGLGLSAGTAAHETSPAILLLLLVTGLRYELPGLLIAACGNMLLIAFLISAHVLVFHAASWRQAAELLAGWELLVLLAALLGHAVLQARRAWFSWEKQRIDSELSPRERALLRLLAQDDLTYVAIGFQLHISEETVKTHVHHLGAKLGVSRRPRIVAEARRRGLLPPPGS